MSGGFIGSIERALGRAAGASYSHPRRTLALVLLLTLGTGVGLPRLGLDTNLERLLPPDFPSVSALTDLSRDFGPVGAITVVGMDAEPEALERFATDVAARLAKVEGIERVSYQRPLDFFEQRALYYLEPDDLTAVRDRLQARIAKERRKRNPMLLDFDDDEEDEDEDEGKSDGAKADAPAEATATGALDFSDIEKKVRARMSASGIGAAVSKDRFFIDRDARKVVVLARPNKPSLDVRFTVDIVARAKAALAEIDPKKYGPDFRVEFTGRYRKKYDQKVQIETDLRRASLLSLGLMLLVLAVHFRRLSAVLLIMAPLVLGLSWTLGLTGLVYGTLNILTGFIGAILLGIGIDHGIHLLSRFDAEQAAGQAPLDAITTAFGNTGRAVLVAGLTTLLAFAGLAFSEFRAFREFGVISSCGLLLIMGAYWVVLPAMLSFGKPREAKARDAEVHADGTPMTRVLRRFAAPLLVVTSLMLLGAGWGLGRVHFATDMKALADTRLPTFRLALEANRILGFHQNPIMVLTGTREREAVVAKAMRDKSKSLGERSMVQFVATAADLVPDKQAEKKRIIDEIGALLRKVKPKQLKPEQRDKRKQVLEMTRAQPFGEDDLPTDVARMFHGVNPKAGFVLVSPTISLTDGWEVRTLADELRSAPTGEPKPRFAGESLIISDILVQVLEEARPVLTITAALVGASLWILLGRLGAALLCFLAAAASVLVTLGVAGWAGLEINYMNMVVIPVLFGLSVDGAVHQIGRVTGEGLAPGESWEAALGEVARAIAGAMLTTALGFGVLIIADHPGLNSFGQLAVIGTAVGLLINLVTLPALLAWTHRRRELSS